MVASGARWRGALPLARSDRHLHPRKRVHDSGGPAVEPSVRVVCRVVGAVEVQSLIFARCGGIYDRSRSPRQHRPQPRPVRAKDVVHTLHMQGEVPEVDAHPDAVPGICGLACVGHVLGSNPEKYRDARGAPGVKMIGPRVSLSGRAVRWVVLNCKSNAGSVGSQPSPAHNGVPQRRACPPRPPPINTSPAASRRCCRSVRAPGAARP